MKIAIICSQSEKEFKSSLILKKFLINSEIKIDCLFIVRKSYSNFNKYYLQEQLLRFLDHLFCLITNFLLGISLKSLIFKYDYTSRKFFRINSVINKFRGNLNKLIYVNNQNSDLVKNILIERNIDILILAGVGIIKDKIISIPNLKIINVHSSVLPGYRGTESEVFALSDKKFDLIGNTVHYVNNKIDGGQILSVVKFPKYKLKYGISYIRYLNKVLSADNLYNTVKNIENIIPKINNISKSVYRSRPTKEVILRAKQNLDKCE